jgi:hypothetical protein
LSQTIAIYLSPLDRVLPPAILLNRLLIPIVTIIHITMNGVPGPSQNNQQAVPIPINHVFPSMTPNKYGTHTSLESTRNVATKIIAVLQSLML